MTSPQSSPRLEPHVPASPAAIVRHLGLGPTEVPDLDTWQLVLRSILAAEGGRSSRYEAIFESSPVPIVEQDYSLVIEEFDRLRLEGVTDLRSYLSNRLDRIRELAKLIRITSVNPAAVSVIGLDPDEAVGPVDPLVVNAEAADAWIDQLECVWEGRTRSEMSFDGATVSGERFDAHRIMVVPKGPYGPDYSTVVMTIQDVTSQADERRRMQRELVKKNEFLGSVSHEIRTPLTGVLGFAELLLDGLSTMPLSDQRELLESVIQQAQDVAHIVEDLLVSSRARAGDLAVTNEHVDLADEVRTVLRNGGDFASGVDLEISTDATRTIGDPGRIRQIARNLLTNAHRYGGSEVTVVIEDQGENIDLSVIDNGPGIPADRIDAVFRPFERTSAGSTTSESAGLGLSICRSLAEAMGGSLTYRYSDGMARFTLSLPRRDR